MATDMTVATTILKQLGGANKLSMVGAKHYTGTANSLSFQFMKGTNGINGVKIILNANDEYDIEFLKVSTPKLDMKTGEIKGGPTVVSNAKGIQAEELRRVFTNHTGLDTSL